MSLPAVQVLPPGADRTDRRSWRAMRRSGIGSSDVSAILGMSKYRRGSVRDIWEQKTGRVDLDDDETSEAAEWGIELEPVVRRVWTRRTGIQVSPIGMHRSLVHPFMLYDADGLTSDGGLYEGKSLDVATPMLTTRGWSTMGELREGDEVFHPDGHPVRVTAAHPVRHDRTCYRITTSDGRSVVADAEHLWTVQDQQRNHKRHDHPWEIVTTAELVARGMRMQSGQARWRLPRQEMVVSKPVDLPIDPYVLGAWLGDGTSGKAHISVGDADLDAMTANLRAVGVTPTVTRKPTAWEVRLGGTDLGVRCRELGVWKDKRVPDVYLSAGTEQRLSLLQGLLDTDGSISERGQVEFCACRRELAEAVLFLARSLGWRANMHVGPSVLNGRAMQPRWRVRFTPSREDRAPFRLHRKLARVKVTSRGQRQFRIERIELVESRPVRCIRVEREDGLFLAGRDLLPTHNTCSLWKRDEWGEDQIPDHAELQVQHGMAVMGLPHAWVAGLIGGQKLVWRRIERDDELIALIIKAEQEFWRHVREDTPPPIDGSEASELYLAERFPRSVPEKVVQVDPATAETIRRAYLTVKNAEHSQTEQETHTKNLVRELMGDAEVAMCGQRVVATWKNTGKFDEAAFRAAHPDLAETYTTSVPVLDTARLADERPELFREFRGRTLLIKRK